MKVFLTYFITVFSFISSHSFGANADVKIFKRYHVAHQVFENLKHQNIVAKNDDFPVFESNPVSQSDNDIINEENDDDDFISIKRNTTNTEYFKVLVYASAFSFSFPSIESVLPLSSHFSYNSVYKYIMQRALRI